MWSLNYCHIGKLCNFIDRFKYGIRHTCVTNDHLESILYLMTEISDSINQRVLSSTSFVLQLIHASKLFVVENKISLPTQKVYCNTENIFLLIKLWTFTSFLCYLFWHLCKYKGNNKLEKSYKPEKRQKKSKTVSDKRLVHKNIQLVLSSINVALFRTKGVKCTGYQ